MESGDTIKITYSVTEVSSSITNKTYQETNTVTVKTKDEKINLNAKVESLVSKFVGDKWYDLKIKKSIDSEKSEETETNTKYYYEVEVSSTIGTLGHEIEFTDKIELSDLVSEKNVTIDEIKIYKITDKGEKEYITNNPLINENTKITGTLPALIKGEKYLISYYLTIDRTPTDEFEITNTASVTSKHVHDEDTLKSSSFIDEKLKITADANSEARHICQSNMCGNFSATNADIEYEVTINTDNNLIKPYFAIDAYFSVANDYPFHYNFQGATTFEFYDANTNAKYKSQILKLPIHFINKSDGFYAVDSENKEVKMNSARDTIIIKSKWENMSALAKIPYSKLIVILTSNGRETIISSESMNYSAFGERYYCYCKSNTPTCSDIKVYVKKELMSNPDFSNNLSTAIWKSTIDISTLKKLDKIPFTITESLSSGVEKKHYYTKEQLENIEVYGEKDDNSKTKIEKSKYTIKGKECTRFLCKESTDNSLEQKYTGFEIIFNDDFANENYKQLTYETTSTIDTTDINFSDFTSNIYGPQYGSPFYSGCNGAYNIDSVKYKNFSSEIDDVIEKYIYNENGSTSKEKNYSYNQDSLYYKVELNKDGTLDGDITYTDTLPEGVELVQSSWSYGEKDFTSSGFKNGVYLEASIIEADAFTYVSSSNFTVAYDQETRALTVTIPENVYHDYSNNNILKLNLYYKVNIVTEFNKDTTLVNRGTVKTSNGEKSSSATADILTAKFNKQIENYNELTGELKYGVKINETGKKLLDGNKIKVVDTLKYPLSKDKIESIELKTVKLYALKNNEKGEKIADLEFETKDIENGIEFEIEIPDEQALYLEYTYKITLTNNYPDHLDISNEIMIKGSTEGWAKDSLSSRTDITGITAHAYTNGVVLTLSKIDGNSQKLLAGATYKVERYTGKEWKSIGKFTTNEDGTIEIGEKTKNGKKFLFQNVAYRVKEVKAPTGYKLDSNYNYIYVYNPLINREIIPKGFDKNNIVNKDKVATLVDYIINVPTNDIINFIVVIFLILSIVGIVILFIRPRTRYEITK